jgi:hypothetical protein
MPSRFIFIQFVKQKPLVRTALHLHRHLLAHRKNPSPMQNAPGAPMRPRFHSTAEITLQRVFLYSEYQFGYGMIESFLHRRH